MRSSRGDRSEGPVDSSEGAASGTVGAGMRPNRTVQQRDPQARCTSPFERWRPQIAKWLEGWGLPGLERHLILETSTRMTRSLGRCYPDTKRIRIAAFLFDGPDDADRRSPLSRGSPCRRLGTARLATATPWQRVAGVDEGRRYSGSTADPAPTTTREIGSPSEGTLGASMSSLPHTPHRRQARPTMALRQVLGAGTLRDSRDSPDRSLSGAVPNGVRTPVPMGRVVPARPRRCSPRR